MNLPAGEAGTSTARYSTSPSRTADLVAEYNTSGTSVTGYRSEYFRTDHLGNTRLTFSDFNQDGVISWKLPTSGPAAQESEITSENHYYPFGLGQKGPWYASVAPENKYLFNGIERNTDWGLNLDLADFRAYDPTVGRWWQVDPIIKFHESVYAGFANSPLLFSDYMGADTLNPIGPDFYDGGNLPTVTVTASAKGGNGDQSMERYGFGGTFAQWQQVYGYQGWSYEGANNYWNHVYQADFEQYVWRRDSVERARIALEKMWFFTGGFSTIGQIYGAGGMPGRLPSPRGFSFSSPVAAKGGLSFNTGVFESFTKHAFAGGRHADLGLSVDIMASKGMNLVKSNMHLLKAGDNTLIGNINGIHKSFKAFVKDGKIMSVNMYPGVSNRATQGTVINFGNVTW